MHNTLSYLIGQFRRDPSLLNNSLITSIWVHIANDLRHTFLCLHQGNDNRSNLHGWKKYVDYFPVCLPDIKDSIAAGRPIDWDRLLLHVSRVEATVRHELDYNVLVKCEISPRALYEMTKEPALYEYKVYDWKNDSLKEPKP